jgi:molecular chaperone HtpG
VGFQRKKFLGGQMDKISDQPQSITIDKEEFSYGFIIEVLTQGLYPNKFHVIREYIQNAFDAIVKWRNLTGNKQEGRIDIKILKPSIFIYDNGTGMDWIKINQYRYVGYSEKQTSENVGFRGIGKLSGISIAEKLIITTSPIGEPIRYKLIFDANSMLANILALKLNGRNIPLNDLIKKHTIIEKEEEEVGAHYSLIELYKLKKDSQVILDENNLVEYLGLNSPLDFHPNFKYGKQIDDWLRNYVYDYNTVPIFLNGNQLFKPFLEEIKPPIKDFIEPEDDNNKDALSDKEPLAFYWYCEHSEKGQFTDEKNRGLLFRIKNFAIGNNHLPRITLWKSTPERAFYFWGEIYILDPNVIPSSSRDDFEQNEARDRLYRMLNRISQKLNHIAGDSSLIRRAKEEIIKAEDTIQKVQSDVTIGNIPREVEFTTVTQVQNVITEVKKRKQEFKKEKHTDPEFYSRADAVIKTGEKIIDEIVQPGGKNNQEVFYDITSSLHFSSEGILIYNTIINCLEAEFSQNSDIYERLIRKIHDDLRLKWIDRNEDVK